VNARNIIESDITKLSEDKNEMSKSLYVDFIRSLRKMLTFQRELY